MNFIRLVHWPMVDMQRLSRGRKTSSLSSESRIGRVALLTFYSFYTENKKQYENFALSLAGEGEKEAMNYLALVYWEENTESGISKRISGRRFFL